MPKYLTVRDFLEENDFKGLMIALDKLYAKGHRFNNSTVIESKKEVFSLNEVTEDILRPIKTVAGNKGKDLIKSLTGWKGEVISLLELKDFGGYAPLHNMDSGGFLGSHIDHTFTDEGKLVHIGNCIFYAVNDWKADWGGQTCFFDKSGFNILNKISPEKNMLLGFVHDCESFHGVSYIKSPQGKYRTTIYMDYYIKLDDLPEFQLIYQKISGEKFLHFNYLTMFIPFGQKANFFASVFSRKFLGYFRNYIRYLEVKRIGNYNNFKTTPFGFVLSILNSAFKSILAIKKRREYFLSKLDSKK